MCSRSELVREMLLLTLGSGAVIVLLIAGVLWFTGAFSWLLFARWILVVALVIAAVELFIMLRVLRVNSVRGSGATWRRADWRQGCTVALIVGLVMLGLLVCGGVLDWWLEFH